MTLKPICNPIFDRGGVVLNIDPQLTVGAFRNLGWMSFFDKDHQALNRELFYDLEMGKSSPEIFWENVRQNISKRIEDEAIDATWSAMILDFPADRVSYLEGLKKNYRLFLLSNTNEIHRIKYHQKFEVKFGYPLFGLFERIFYSHEMGLRKPDPEFFVRTLKESGLVSGETLFIDDMKENTDAAKILVMRVLHIQPGTLPEKLPQYLLPKPIFKGDFY